MRPEIEADVNRVIAEFRQECRRVLGESRQLRGSMREPPEGWREYFTRRIYTGLLKYKEEVEAIVEAHLKAEERV